MSALSAVQPRSVAPARSGRPAESGSGEDFSAVLAAVGGVAAEQRTTLAGQGGSAPEGEGSASSTGALHLPAPVPPAAPAELAAEQAPVAPGGLQAPDAVPARPAGLALALPVPATTTVAVEASPSTAPAAAPAPATVQTPGVLPTAPTAPTVTTAGTPAAAPAPALPAAVPADADLPLVPEVQVRSEPAPAVEPQDLLAEPELPTQVAVGAPAASAPDAAADLPPVAAAAVPAPAATAAVAAAAPPAEAAPAPPPPAAQLLTGLAPVLEGPDGAHTMSLQLYPEELGAVQVEISLRNGEISLALRTADVGTLEVLRSATAELRTALESSGLTSTGVSVDLGRGHENPAQQGGSSRGTRSGDGQPPDAADEPATTATSSDSTLDVRI